MSIGLFYDASNASAVANPLNTALLQLQDEIQILIRLKTKALSTFSAALIFVPAMAIFAAAFVLAITTKYEVGLSLGFLGLFIQFLVLAGIAIGKQCFNVSIAWNASFLLSSFVRQVNLITKFLFYYPRRRPTSTSPVKIQTVQYRLPQSPNTPHLILMLLKRMWLAMDKQYNPFVVRLQRFMHQSTYPLSTKRAHKRICCLPAYLVVIMLGVAILVDLLLLRIYNFNAIEMLTDIRVLPIFVIMSSIIFLGVCASVPSLANAAFAFFYRPKTPLTKAIESYATEGSTCLGAQKKSKLINTFTSRLSSAGEPIKPNGDCLSPSVEAADLLPVTSSCEVDILAKREFANICDMLHAFNFYLQDIEQTRLVVMIDATEATSPVQLAGVFYQVHSLVLTQPNAPIAFVIATDIKSFFERPEKPLPQTNVFFQESRPNEPNEALNLLQSIADCNHLILFSVHLPIFLDSSIVENDSLSLLRFPGAGSLQALLQRSTPNTPVTPQLLGDVSDEAGEETARQNHATGNNTGQINKAYTSAEELGVASKDVWSDASVMKATQSTTSLSVQNQSPGVVIVSQPSVIKNVNISRLTATKAGAKGIAEIFLANEEMAEQNVPVIKTLVAVTAFTSRLIRLNSMSLSIKQLTNWVYMTQHWPYHMAWLTVMLEDEEEVTNPPVPAQRQVQGFPSLVAKAMDEISALPPVGSILSGDDRDPAKLLHFIQNQLDCYYSIVDLRHLVEISLFISPFVRICIKEIRQCYFGEQRFECRESDLERSLLTPNRVIREPRAVDTQSFSVPHVPESDYRGKGGAGSGGGGGGGGGETQNDSSGEICSPPHVSLDSEPVEKGMCYANPSNVPAFFSPCPIRLRTNIPMKGLSKMNVEEVCSLLSAISDLPPTNCSSYQMQIRRQNITGQVLSVCDLTKLRSELQMSFGDWQLFNTFVTFLRSVEAEVAERSRNSHPATFFADMKSPHGSLTVSSPYPYSQVLVSPSPFVFCNEQSQGRGKNMFDVPVLVQQVPVETAVANIRHNTDRTTSDFSFGSGTDEMELAWRRDVQPDSLNNNNSMKYQHTGREATSRPTSGHTRSTWLESAEGPLCGGLSKSTHDLRSATVARKSQGNTSTSANLEKRCERNSRKSDKQIPPPLFHSTSSAPDHLVQMVPAYIPRAPDSSGFIPLWYPTLPYVGEAKSPQRSQHLEDDYPSGFSSVSVDGTYDFPSDYSNADRDIQQKASYRHQCPANCPRSHRSRRRRRKSSRSSRSSNRTAQKTSSRRSSFGRSSQKNAEGCTCDYFLYGEGRSARGNTNVNPWTIRSPRKISSPDLSDIEAMTSS
uniref:KAP NTPase domain-containing protein n=1 Tax=Mesocestoides corti TaxID=53468 RepID=A0A5K3FHD5_MESCO